MSKEHVHLLGKIALEEGLISRDQFDKSLAIQAAGKSRSALGEVLLDLGYIDRNQLRYLVAKQESRLKETGAYRRRDGLDAAWGRLLARRGYCDEARMTRCFEEKTRREAQGRIVSLESLLVEQEILSAVQWQLLTRPENKKTVVCAGCGNVYRVIGWKDGYRLRCGACRAVLVPPRSAIPEDEVAAGEDLCFDEEGAENISGIARASVGNGLLTLDAIESALETQANQRPLATLEEVLLESGALDPAGALELQKRMSEAQDRRESTTKRRLRSLSFGEIVVREGLLPEGLVERGVKLQSDEKDRGETKRRIGIILVAERYLTKPQVLRVLSRQGKSIGTCSRCVKQYNVGGLLEGSVRCPSCKEPLELPEEPGSIDVSEEIRVGEELAVIDLSQGGEDPTIQKTRRMFRDFYQKEGMGSDGSSAMGPLPGVTGAAVEAPAPKKMAGKTRAFVLSRFRPGKAVLRGRWGLPLVGAGMVFLIAGVSVAGYFLMGAPTWATQPRPSETPRTEVESSTWPVPTQGSRVEVYGRIPAGDPDAKCVIAQNRQAFLVTVKEGEAYWLVDAAGRSGMRLRFLRQPGNRDAEILVRACGRFTRQPPEGLVLPSAQVEGFLVLEEWAIVKSGGYSSERTGSLRVLPPRKEDEGEPPSHDPEGAEPGYTPPR